MKFPKVETFECLIPVECDVEDRIPPEPDDRCIDPAFAVANPDLCPNQARLILKPSAQTICQLRTAQFRTFLVNDNIETEITIGVSYYSSNSNVALIGGVSGKATGVDGGIATINSEWQGLKAFSQLTVIGEDDCCDDVKVGMLLVIDNSRSMQLRFNPNPGEDGPTFSTRLSFAKAIARRLAGEVNEQKDVVGLMTFNEAASLVEALTHDREAVRGAITNVALTSRGTNLEDAINDATDLLEADTTLGRRVIILFTDGENNQGGDPLPRAMAFQEAGGIIIVVAIRASGDAYALTSKLASGGFFISAHQANAFDSFYWLSGMKAYFCAGRCEGEGNTVVNLPQLNFANFTNWDVTQNEVDLIGGEEPYASYDFLPGNGLYLDMAGSGPGFLGQITSKVDYTITGGRTYKLSYYLAGNQRSSSTPFTVNVRIYDPLNDYDMLNEDVTINDWQQDFTLFENYFVPSFNGTGRISFTLTANGSSPSFGLLLDNIEFRLIKELPETEDTVLLSDSFDSENPQYIPPKCGSAVIPPGYTGSGGYSYGYDCYSFPYCLAEPLPGQIPDPNPAPDIEG